MACNPIRFIESYVHDYRIGVLVEFEMTTALSAPVPEVAGFMKDMALQIAAADPIDVDDLLLQGFVKDPDILVKDQLQGLSEYVSEDFSITRFARWETSGVTDGPKEPPSAPANIARLGSAS